MNTKAVKSFGLALMLAAGVLAVLLALGTFSPQKAGAQVSTDGVSARPNDVGAGDPLILTVGFQVADGSAITAGQEIAIKLPGVAVPGDIAASDVSIRSGASAGSPSAVAVSTKDGVSTVTLTLGNDSGGVPMFVTGTSDAVAQVYVTFTKAAGLAAGKTAGNYFVQVDGNGATTGDAVANRFNVSPSVTVSHKAGFTSAKLMVSGASFPAGVVDITVVDSTGDPATCVGVTPGTAVTADKFDGIAVKSGAFSVPIKIAVGSGPEEFRYGTNCVFVSHSAGGVDGAEDLATGLQPAGQVFGLSAKVTPATDELVRGGDGVDVEVEEGPDGAIVESVTIDGTQVPFAPKAAAGAAQATPTVDGGTIADGSDTTDESRTLDTDGEITLVINVKNVDGAALAAASEVSLSVVATSATTPTTLGSATVNVVSLPLDLRPDTVVQGTTVKLNASGFGSGGIGGSGTGILQITGSDDGATVRDIDVTANTVGGRYTFIFTVPDLPAGESTVRLTQSDGKIGEGTLTVSTPTIVSDTAESRVGTNIRLTGTGFPAGGSVIITYGGTEDVFGAAYISDTVIADVIGGWEAVIQVPSGASGTNNIQAFRAMLTETIAERMSNALEHTVPDATLDVSPKVGLTGDTVTVSGTAHPPRTIVEITIGGVVVSDRDDRTDSRGDFSLDVEIPAVTDEFPTLVVRVNGVEVIGGRVIVQILTEAPAPDSRAPADVFASLDSAGTLEAFWGYDNDDGVWRVYVPGNSAADNARLEAADLLLTEVNPGDAGWINLNDDDSFQGRSLSAGWRLIAITN